MKHHLYALVAVMLSGASVFAEVRKDQGINLLPWPQKIEVTDGSLELTPQARVVATDPSLKPLATIVAGELETITGTPFTTADGDAKAGDIVLGIDAGLRADADILTSRDLKFARVRDYAHTLDVTDRVTVTGWDYRATVEGTATLLQAVKRDGQRVSIPKLKIKDWPVADFQGSMVDVGRQDISIEALKQVAVASRLYKVRYVLLHLSDDQGWTFPSTAYPQAGKTNSAAHGGVAPRVYDLQQLKNLVAFADARGVTFIPEIETPGHSGAIRTSLPDVFDSIDPATGMYRGLAIMNMVKPEMYKALDTIVGEASEVFKSSPYFHIGCDETRWDAIERAPEVRAYMTAQKLDHGGLFKQHVLKMLDIVKRHGKQTIIWEGGANTVSKEIICMTWDGGTRNAERLVAQGFTTITVPWTIDVPQYEWNLYHCNGSILKPTDNVIGGLVPMWEMSEIELVHTNGYLYDRYAIRSDGTWNPSTTYTEADWKQRSAHTMYLQEQLMRPIRLTTSGVDEQAVHKPTIFLDTVTLTMDNLIGKGTIHYTLDGTEPTAASPAYAEPVKLRKSAELVARLFDDAGKPIGFRTMGKWKRVGYEKNLTTGKPIVASPGTEDRYTPENAVDGRPDTAWWAGPGPKSLQVDLGKAYDIDRIDVFPYFDNRRFYTYTVEASTDGKTWTQVVDMTANTKPHTESGDPHAIKAMPMRYVKVTLLKNSANESVHLAELRVYEVGKHPTADAAVN